MGPLVRNPRPSTAPSRTAVSSARPPSRRQRWTPSATASVVHRASNMSDMATRPKLMNSSVVACTMPPASPVRRPKSSDPSQTVAQSARRAAATGTSRAASGVNPRSRNARAMSQYVSAGLS